LVFLTCYVAYEVVAGIIDIKAIKSAARVAIDNFHDHFNRDDLSSACEDEFAWQEPALDCMSQLKDIRLRLGSFQRLKKVKFEVISEPRWVRIETVSIFDKGELTERFLARPVSDSELAIVNYQTLMTPDGIDRIIALRHQD
jgi:hypothetical protein